MSEDKRLDKVEIARVCGRFSRLKEQSKKTIGYNTLAEMASLASSKKSAKLVRKEIGGWLESQSHKTETGYKFILRELDTVIDRLKQGKGVE